MTLTQVKSEMTADINQMLEDYWLPRREGGRGTEITTLPGGENLGQLDDVEYFQRKLYKAMHVPVSRLEADSGFSLGEKVKLQGRTIIQ